MSVGVSPIPLVGTPAGDAPASISAFLADPERKLTEQEAALVLGVQPSTLATWRCTKRYGVPFIKIGRCVRYRAGDLAAWLQKHTVRPVEVET